MQTRSQTRALSTPAYSQRPRRQKQYVDYIDYDSESDNDSVYEPEPAVVLAPKYTVDIDFDEASRAWLANKRFVGKCQYVYKESPISRNKIREEVAEHITRRSTRLAAKVTALAAK